MLIYRPNSIIILTLYILSFLPDWRLLQAIHEDTDPDLNQHIIMTLQKESYLTPFRSDLSPSYTGELSISKFNCKDGKLCESYDLAGLVLVILLTDMGYPRRESARDGRF